MQPEKYPKKVSISRGLESLQKMVGGYISFTYPFKEDVGIVLNDEGKLLGLPFNRALRDENGNPYDIINGDFLVVGLTDDDISSLSPELMDKFERLFLEQPRPTCRTRIPLQPSGFLTSGCFGIAI